MNASEAIQRLEREFVALLTEQLSAVPGYRVTSALDIRLGSDLQVERRRLRESADVVVELDSAAAGWDEHPGSTARRPIRVALEGRPRGADRTADVVHCADQPFSQCPNRRARLRFIERVLELIHDRLRETVTTGRASAAGLGGPAARRPAGPGWGAGAAAGWGDLARLRCTDRAGAAAAGRDGARGGSAAGVGYRQLADGPAPVRAARRCRHGQDHHHQAVHPGAVGPARPRPVGAAADPVRPARPAPRRGARRGGPAGDPDGAAGTGRSRRRPVGRAGAGSGRRR